MNSRRNSFPRGKHLIVSFFLVASLCFYSALGEELEFPDIDTFREKWEGVDNIIEVSKPSEIREYLNLLDDSLKTSRWAENEEVGSPMTPSHKYPGLGEYCKLSSAKITVTYFGENAVAYVSPCNQGDKNCYLDPEKTIEWKEVTFSLDVREDETNEVSIDMVVLPGGYIIFDKITISHDGQPMENCLTTTTEETTPTTEEPSTVTTEATSTPYTEGTGDSTWFSIPSTSPTTPTTTTITTSTTDNTDPEETWPSEEEETETTTSFENPSTTDTESTSPSPPDTDSTSPNPTDTDSTSLSTTASSITPPRATTPISDESGFTLTQILLYFLLPIIIGLLLLLVIVCYCCNYMHKPNYGRRFENYGETPSNRSSSSNTINPLSRPTMSTPSTPPSFISVGAIDNTSINLSPNGSSIQSRFEPALSRNSSHASAFAPVSINRGGGPNQFVLNNLGPPTFNTQYALNPLSPSNKPANSSTSVLLNIPNMQHSHSNLNGQRSNGSSFRSARKFPMYTGEDVGTELPRMRRRLD